MLQTITPATLFHNQVHRLHSQLPAVLDGEPTGIHDARIATRRIRELLPLLVEDRRWNTDDLARRFRRLGRLLGRVRDADVRVTLLASLEQRIPHAAPTLVVVRQRREHERLALMRKLIKRLERLDAIDLVASLSGRTILHRPSFTWPRAGKWRRTLRGTIVERAEAASNAITHATGVYFPKRAHAARIAIKKLRYALEVVNDTGIADEDAALRDLKKGQDVLGDLHDQQELIDHLADFHGQDVPEGQEQVALICQVIEAEARRLHGRYLERRARLLEVCASALDMGSPRVSAVPAIAVAAALSSGVYVARRLRIGGRVAG